MAKVEVVIKSVYGKMNIYPNNATAELFCGLTGKKTFSRTDIATIQALGFVVEQVLIPAEL